jgi:hypothetical protein
VPLLVHIAGEQDIGSIRRAGIRIGKFRDGVYAMPVLKNFMVSHQWLRELKRSGARTLCAVHFRIPDSETVKMGHYSKEHVAVTAAAAAGAIMHAEDPLGMEIIVPRAIGPKEIHAIRSVPQVLGWRYFPGAHARKPCGCPYCQWRGGIRTRKLREQFEAENGG